MPIHAHSKLNHLNNNNMNTVISVFQFLLKLFTTIADLLMKIPQPIFWAIKLIPGVGNILTAIEGQRTVAAGFIITLLAFMEKQDWTSIGAWSCEAINFILQLFNKSWVCDSSWLPTIATMLTAILLTWLRILGKGEVPSSIKPMTTKK